MFTSSFMNFDGSWTKMSDRNMNAYTLLSCNFYKMEDERYRLFIYTSTKSYLRNVHVCFENFEPTSKASHVVSF